MARKENTPKYPAPAPEKENKPRDRVAASPEKEKKATDEFTEPKKKKKPVKKEGFMGRVDQVIDFLQSPRGRKIVALSLLAGSLFLLVAFVSHFFTGFRDQSLVEDGGMLGNPAKETPGNWLGSVGAFFAHVFISRGFGLMGLLIPVYMGLWGYALLENDYYKSVWRLLRHVLFAVLWGSTFFAFMSQVIVGYVGDLGGGFGWFMTTALRNYIGIVGVGLLVVISFLIYLVVNWNTEFPLKKWFTNLFIAKEPELSLAGVGGDTLVVDMPETQEQETENAKKEEQPEDLEDEEDDDGEEITMEITQGGGAENASPGSDDIAQELPLDTIVPVIPKAKVPESLELEISENQETVIDSLHPESDNNGASRIAPISDNIVQVDEDKFEKFIAEEDEESLGDDADLADWDQYDPTLELSNYQFPPLDLLIAYDGNANREVNRQELEENKNKIVRTLNNYKIEIVSIKATIGPTVTLYEIVPAPGVRISKIKNLEDDIALSLSALGIRIIAPIPGKGTIGIEIPNSNPEIVSMRSTLATERFRDTKAELPIALGKTISNEVFIADLAKMPHLLIAGATGQGKSVGINGLIASLLYKKHPSQIKFVLIDPKKVELSLYSALEKHFIAKLESIDENIITDTKQVIYVLNSLCIEMDQRYDLLKRASVRNLREYNTKFMNRRLNPKKGHRYLPYIVLIIDEFADLMMTAGKEIETPIARLAQLARAIGIHLVLATQRPSVNVITGIIKANFPARVSFRVTSKVDSRTILDTGGADQLVGRGDLLFSSGNDLIRIQNSFIDTPEVDKMVEFISSQRGYSQPYFLPEVPMEAGAEDDDDDHDPSERDEMFAEAARLVVRHQQGSTSLIQRRLKLGYNRAGRVIDQLEHAGVVGPFSGSKAREVLIRDEAELERILSGLR